MTPDRLLLNIHLQNRVRMSKVNLPMGTSRTKWLNDCIAQRLDRDYPETIGMVAAPPLEPVKTIDPMEILAQARRAAIPLDYVGPYTLKHQNRPEWRLAVAEHKKRTRKGESIGLEAVMEGIAIRSKLELSDAEKSAIMEKHKAEQSAAAAKTMESAPDGEIPEHVKGHPVLYNKWRAEEDAKRQAVDADFWGDDEADKVRALVKRHTR